MFCFSRVLPVWSWSVASALGMFWPRIGVPNSSGGVASVVWGISVLQPIGDVSIGVCDRSRSTSRSIASFSVASSVTSSSSEVSLSAYGLVDSEPWLEESYTTTRLYGRFFSFSLALLASWCG